MILCSCTLYTNGLHVKLKGKKALDLSVPQEHDADTD